LKKISVKAKLVFVMSMMCFCAAELLWASNWNSSGPYGSVRSTLTVDPSNADTIYITAALSGVYKTTDAGLNWFKADIGLAPNATQIVVNPSNGLQLFALASGRIFRSFDGGANWGLASVGLNGVIEDISISSTTPTMVYAAGEVGVFKSTTLGASWTLVNTGLALNSAATSPIEVDPLDGEHVLVGQRDSMGERSLFETINGGISWAPLIGSWDSSDFFRDIAFGPGPVVYLATGRAVHSKTGAGAWTEGAMLNVGSIDPHPLEVGRALASPGPGGVFETINSGATWTASGPMISANGFDLPSASASAYRPGSGSTIYAMAFGVGFQLSTDGGATWAIRNNGLQAYNIRAVAVHPGDPNFVYAGASDGITPMGGIYLSEDKGLTWSQSNFGLDLLGVRDIAIDPNTTSDTAATHLYASGYGRISVDGVSPNEVGLFKSVDGGATWVPRRNGIPDAPDTRLSLPLRRLVMDPASGSGGGTGPLQTLYVAGSGNPNRGSARVYKSVDAGANWIASETGLPALPLDQAQIVIDLVIDPLTPTTLYVGTLMGTAPMATTANGVFKSVDGGMTWTHSSAGLPQKEPTVADGSQQDILALAIDPVTPSTLYAGVRDSDPSGPSTAQIYKSANGGASWTISSTGISPSSDVRAIKVDPDNPATVYAALAQVGGSPGGVYRSDDFGATWSSISVGLPVSSVTSLAIDNSGVNSMIYAGTGSGVFGQLQLPDADLDGASSQDENAAPNGGDGNNDGIPDVDQTSVASIPLSSTRREALIKSSVRSQGAGSQPYLTIAIRGGSCDNIVNAQVLSVDDYPQEPAYELPVGMVSFELPGCESAIVDLIYADTDLAIADRFRNFGPQTPGDLSTLSNYDFANAARDDNTWTLTLGDGELGDVRPQDGAILFRGGPASFINDLFADGFE